jgi:hypothetical protein
VPIYEYQCRNCKATVTSTIRRDTFGSCNCDLGELKRKYSFSHKPAMQEHFNATVGQPISSMTKFKDALARRGEEYHHYTGIETNYQPLDLSDTQACKVTNEGLDSTNRVRIKNGMNPIEV